MSDHELPLVGGVSTDVVRIGDTIRRPLHPWSSSIHTLWTHLRSRGFTAVPKFLGVDKAGREILEYVEGTPGVPPLDRGLASKATLVASAELIRSFHDAAQDFSWQDCEFSASHRDPRGTPEVVCHNDLAPFNIVYRGERPVTILDWDLAAPGSRLWDFAYAAWRLVPLHRPAYCEYVGWPALEGSRSERLRIFCDAYGVEDRDRLLETIRERQRLDRTVIAGLVKAGRLPALPIDHPGAEAGDLAYLEANWSKWRAALA